jgi:hypothetical protein
MFTKTAIALALLVGTASAVLAAPKSQNTNPRNDVFDITGKYLGSDPDPTVLFMLRNDSGND